MKFEIPIECHISFKLTPISLVYITVLMSIFGYFITGYELTLVYSAAILLLII